MSEIIKNTYLDLSGLKKYDNLIKEFIASGDQKLVDAIKALEAKIGEFDFEGSDAKNLAEIIEGIYASIADIVAAQDGLGAKDAELEGKINSIISDLESLEGSTLSEITAKLLEIEGSLSKNATDIAGVTDRVSALEETVKELEEFDYEALAAAAAADAVAAVVADADSDFDTLKEVADWIASDKEGSAALQITVSGHTESINTINSDIDALEAKVEEDITNLTTHMSDAATVIAGVEGRLDALEAVEETHTSIDISDIESLFSENTGSELEE